MEELSGPIHIWVRTQKGSVYGPLIPSTVELLIDRGTIQGPIQIALDGKEYVYPGRVPGIRMVIPRELWGEGALPEHPKDREWSAVVLPPSLDATMSATTGSHAAIAPAPGAAPASAPVVAPAAGPVLPPLEGARLRGSGSQPRYVPGTARPHGAPVSSPSAIQRNPTESSPTMSPPAPARPPPAPVAPSAPPEALAPPPPPASAPMAPSAASTSSAAMPVSVTQTAIPAAGQLSAFSPMRAYFLAASAEATALLTLTLSDRTLSIHFRKGSPDCVDSTHADDAIATVLVKNKLLTPEAVQQAEGEKGRFGGELLPALFGLGLVNPNSALTHLMQRATSILQRALLAEQGTFTWETKEFQGQKAFPLGNKWGLYVEQLRKTPSSEVRRRLTPMLDLPVMRGSSTVQASDLRLTPQELRALTSFDGTRTLHQLARDLPAEADTLFRTAWVLSAAGLVSFAAVRQVSAPAHHAPYPGGPPPSAPAPAPAPGPAPAATAPAAPSVPPPPPAPSQPPPAASSSSRVAAAPPPGGAAAAPPEAPRVVSAPTPAPVARPVITAPSPAVAAPAKPKTVESSATPVPVATISFEEDLKKTLALRENLKKANHFEVLGVDKKAEGGVIKAAYFKLARSFHPDLVNKDAPPELARAKADIFAMVGEANRILSDAKLRKEYELELEAGTSEKVDLQAILKGEECFRKGVINVKARKWPEALKLLDEAIAANADEPEFYAWRGYARFFTIADKKEASAAAVPEIDKCLAKNPRVAAAYYFKGFIAKSLGDMNAAKNNFKKCVELDANHIDAQRELRMMK